MYVCNICSFLTIRKKLLLNTANAKRTITTKWQMMTTTTMITMRLLPNERDLLLTSHIHALNVMNQGLRYFGHLYDNISSVLCSSYAQNLLVWECVHLCILSDILIETNPLLFFQINQTKKHVCYNPDLLTHTLFRVYLEIFKIRLAHFVYWCFFTRLPFSSFFFKHLTLGPEIS